jgi:DNA-binding transcriptional MerR regulator
MSITLNNETYYTAKELSVKFKVSMETIRLWRKNKGLKGHLIGERKYFYSENDIEGFIKGK